MAEQLNEIMLEKNNKLKLSAEDKQILDELYRMLGEQYYKGAFEDPLPQLLPIFDKITGLFKKYEESNKKCRVCGADLEDDARFCELCGAPVKEEKNVKESSLESFCRNCGNSLRPEAKFCGVCGTPVK